MKRSFAILFVCTGNTCRSPLAEAITKAELRKAGIREVSVSSAGTGAVAGLPASPYARLAAKDLGIAFSRFRTRPLTPLRVKRANLILTMGDSQKQEIVRRWPGAMDKTFVISEYSGSLREGIKDPIGESEDAYISCARALEDEIRRILPRVKRSLKPTRRRRK